MSRFYNASPNVVLQQQAPSTVSRPSNNTMHNTSLMQSISIDDSNASSFLDTNENANTSSMNNRHVFTHLTGTSKTLFNTPLDITPIAPSAAGTTTAAGYYHGHGKRSSTTPVPGSAAAAATANNVLQTLLFDSPASSLNHNNSNNNHSKQSSAAPSDASPSLHLEEDEESHEEIALDDSTNRILAGLEEEFGDSMDSPIAAPSNNNNKRSLDDDEEEDEEREEGEEGEEAEEASEEPALTDSARKRKEDEESERLAWELMRQEQEELYNMQLQFIQSQQGQMSDEDYQALQAILQENTVQMRVLNAVGQEQRAEEGEGEEGEQGEEEGEEQEEEEEEWDYERLLALGQALGDVKTERWRLRAKTVIESLPTTTYCEVIKEQSDEDGDYRCVVCMENFEDNDELRVMPCKHYFHMDCTAGWMADHNSCPTCKRKVTSSP